MAVRDIYSDRREPQQRPRRELRNRIAMEHHITVEHGDAIPANLEAGFEGVESVAMSRLRWHHDVMHDNGFLMNVPHEH